MSGTTPRHPDAPARYGGRGAEGTSGPAPPTTGRPPLWRLQPVVVIAFAYGLATVVWAVLGDHLPGGRWLAVHLYTLGVMTNLIVVLTDHFARTITRVPGDERRGWRVATLNLGVLLVLVGLPQGWTVAFAAGATIATVAVMWLYLALRGMRRRALGPRFGYVVRAYERACGAFLHGAILGALLGVGVLAGHWYASVRLAHLAVNVLGWGGLVLLATLVFFAPTLMRTEVDPRAERLAVPALRHGATALTVGVVGLIVAGAPGVLGTAGRVVGVAGLAGFTAATVAVALPVLRTARRAEPSASAGFITLATAWFPPAATLGTVAVALDAPALIDAAGVAVLAGVLGQAIVASTSYLLPMVAGAEATARDVMRRDLSRGWRTRAIGLNLGVGALVVATATRAVDLPISGLLPGLVPGPVPVLVGAAWTLVAATLAATFLLALLTLVRARQHRAVATRATPDRAGP